MADQKISQLTGGGAAQATDEYVVARAGGNNKITGANVAAAATSVGTLSSLTVSGDLTVDTSTLKVDSANNRVGIGMTDPATALNIGMANAATTSLIGRYNTSGASATGTFRVGAGEFTIAQQVRSYIDFVQSYNGSSNDYDIQFTTTKGGVGGGVRAIIDASGNLGLGVTPSASNACNNFQIGPNGDTLSSRISVPQLAISSNAVGNWYAATYKVNGYATQYTQQGNDGTHAWFTAASGTAGNTITFTQAMTLDASGNLGLGITAPTMNGGGTSKVMHINAAGANEWAISHYTNATTGTGGSDGGIVGIIGTDFVVTNYEAGPVIFATNGGTERARITSGGYFKASNDGTYVGSTGSYHELRNSTTGLEVAKFTQASSSDPYGVQVTFSAASPNGTGNWFLYCNDSTALRAEIRSNGGIANYSANNVNLASDERLKKDIAPLASTWDKLKAIEVVNFRYKDCNEGDPALYGVIAQQVQPIVPDVVVVTRQAVAAKDAVLDEDGNEVEPAVEASPEYYGIREQPMYWLAINTLQEAQARIEALEARLEALEA
jgi:hypothetical protein